MPIPIPAPTVTVLGVCLFHALACAFASLSSGSGTFLNLW
jgi:hypothetical protein